MTFRLTSAIASTPKQARAAALSRSLSGAGFWPNLAGVAARKRPSKTQGKLRSQTEYKTTTPKRRRRIVDPDDFDDESTEDLLSAQPPPRVQADGQDRSLTLFFRHPPQGADHFLVYASTPHGETLVQDRMISELDNPAATADLVLDNCTRWAAAEGQQTRFRILWQHSDRLLASYQMVCGTGDATQLDGSVNSFMMQHQRHAEVRERISHQGFELVQEAWRTLQSSSMERIIALERDNAALRERLKKAGDVEAEIAYSTVAAEIEQKQRTTEILESRLMPILQGVLMQKLGIPTGGNAASTTAALLAAAAAQDHQQKEDSEPPNNPDPKSE